MKTVLKKWSVFFSPETISKVDDIKIQRNVSLFSPSSLSSPFSLYLSVCFCLFVFFCLFSSFGVISRPFGLVKSKWIWLFWCKVLNTVFINPDIIILHQMHQFKFTRGFSPNNQVTISFRTGYLAKPDKCLGNVISLTCLV